MLKLIALFWIFLMSLYALSAAEASYGIFGQGIYNFYDAEFSSLPEVPNCCPLFDDASGYGVLFGMNANLPVYKNLFADLRVGFLTEKSFFADDEYKTIIIDDALTGALLRHELNTSLFSVNIDIMAKVNIDALSIIAGIETAIILGNDYSQTEKLIEPHDFGTFENGLRERNQLSGKISDARNPQFSAVFGLAYDFQFDQKDGLHFVPEFFFTHNLLSAIHNLNWQQSSLRFGLNIQYHPDIIAPVVPDTIHKIVVDTPEVQHLTYNKPEVIAHPVKSDSSSAENSIVVEEFQSTSLQPLLNYIFFDENSSVIPKRYYQQENIADKTKSIDDLISSNTLETYYNILNIIGFRMRSHPDSKIKLLGFNSGIGAEQGNLKLSHSRAENVKQYLSKVWAIDSKRIEIQAHNLPFNHSNTDEPDGIEENRRVEITSDKWEVTSPIIVEDTLTELSAESIVFDIRLDEKIIPLIWELDIKQNGISLKKFSGEKYPPKSISWDFANDIRPDPNDINLKYELFVLDSNNTRHYSEINSFNIEKKTLKKKFEQNLKDEIIEKYSLILFDFNKSDLSEDNNRIAEFIRERLKADAQVTISGFTDRTGAEEYNKKLSGQRALSTAGALGLNNADIIAAGESHALFDNDLPEGRFYCRTVQILVITPVR